MLKRKMFNPNEAEHIPLRHLQNHVSSFPSYIYNKTYHSTHQLQLLTSDKSQFKMKQIIF